MASVAPPGYVLASNASATGSDMRWPGGTGLFTVHATTWNGGTVKLQYLGPDGTTYIDADAGSANTFATLSNDGSCLFTLPICYIRVNIVTATGVYAEACPISPPA